MSTIRKQSPVLGEGRIFLFWRGDFLIGIVFVVVAVVGNVSVVQFGLDLS